MRFDLPDEKKLAFELVLPIRWGDLDAMGHVNNTLYFRYFEIIRVDWLSKLGAPPNPDGEGPVLVNAYCNFMKQLEYPGDILARLYVAQPGRSSFETYVTLQRCDLPEVMCAAGGARTVWVDFKKKKSIPLPDWLRREIE